MSGNVTTAGDVNVMPGGTLRVAKTTIGGNQENGGTVQMNSEGGKPGNVLLCQTVITFAAIAKGEYHL